MIAATINRQDVLEGTSQIALKRLSWVRLRYDRIVDFKKCAITICACQAFRTYGCTRHVILHLTVGLLSCGFAR